MDSEEASYLSLILWYLVYLLLCFGTCMVLRCLQPNRPQNASEMQALGMALLYDVTLIELVRISYRINWYFLDSTLRSLPYALMHVLTSVLPTLLWALLSHIALVIGIGIMQLLILRLIHKEFTLADQLESSINKYSREPISSQSKIEASISRHADQLLSFIPHRPTGSKKSADDTQSSVTRTDEFVSLVRALLNFKVQISSLAAAVILITRATVLQNVGKARKRKHSIDIAKAITYPMAVGVVALVRFLARRLYTELRRGVVFVKHVLQQSKDSVDSRHEITEEELLPTLESKNGTTTKESTKSHTFKKQN